MLGKFTHTSIREKEKAGYLIDLDEALRVLETNLRVEKNTYVEERLNELAQRDNWNRLRLPAESNIYSRIADLVSTVRQEYSWLDWIVTQNPLQNRGFFEEITINAETGLPWQHDFITLKRLRNDAKTRKEAIPRYDELANRLTTILMEDQTDIEEVSQRCSELHKDAMRRNFFDLMIQTPGLTGEGLHLNQTKGEITMKLGGETLWQVQKIDYNLANGMFQIYLVDVWQDNLHDPILTKKGTQIEVNQNFQTAMSFATANSAWYVLSSIDSQFPGLHPVHVSKFLIGPYENKYQTKAGNDQLNITKEILREDPNAALLRATRMYSYAPNHEDNKGITRQRLYQENWKDEIIIAPNSYASRIASSLKGSSIRIFTR